MGADSPEEAVEYSTYSKDELIGLVTKRADELNHLLDTVDDLVVILDGTGRIERVNHTIETVLGFTPSAVIGEPIDVLLADSEASDDLVAGGDIVELLLDEEADSDQAVAFQHTDGDVVPMWLTASQIHSEEGTIEGFVCIAMAQGEHFDRELDLKRRNKQFELLNQIVRHDIRNDANLIMESVRRLTRSLDDTEGDLEPLLTQIEEGAGRITELTERMRDLMRAFAELEEERQPIDLNQLLIQEVAHASTLSQAATVRLEDDPPAVTVLANEMLSSVFRNLLTNAINHNDTDEPEITISTEVDEETVTISIADNGPGLPDSLRASIESGSITLDHSDTNGFGLYIVSTLIDQYDGDIEVADRDPRGTVFHLTLERD